MRKEVKAGICYGGLLLATIAVFFFQFEIKADINSFHEKWEDYFGKNLYVAWTSMGVYLARFAFTTLLLASFVDNVVRRFVEPHKKFIKTVHEWLEQDFAAFDKGNVPEIMSYYYEDCRKQVKEAEDVMNAKVDEVVETCYPKCLFGAFFALSVTFLGIDNYMGILSILLLWPMVWIWFKCKQVCDCAEQEAEAVKNGFKHFTSAYRKGLTQENKSYTNKLKVE